jgi:hypothetical protein
MMKRLLLAAVLGAAVIGASPASAAGADDGPVRFGFGLFPGQFGMVGVLLATAHDRQKPTSTGPGPVLATSSGQA